MLAGNFGMPHYGNQIKKYPLISREEEFVLATKAKSGCQNSTHQLINHNLRFVLKEAHKYRSYCDSITGITFNDIVQAGNLGLVKATKRFEPARGLRFITYAVWWIRSCIKLLVLKSKSIVSICTTNAQRALFFHQSELNDIKYATADSKDSMRAALARKLNLKKSDVLYMEQRLGAKELGWDTPLSHSGGEVISNLVSTPAKQEQSAIINEHISMLRQSMSQINERERIVLARRFEDGAKLREIGEELGLSRERIRQIEANAIQKLRISFKLMGSELQLAA